MERVCKAIADKAGPAAKLAYLARASKREHLEIFARRPRKDFPARRGILPSLEIKMLKNQRGESCLPFANLSIEIKLRLPTEML